MKELIDDFNDNGPGTMADNLDTGLHLIDEYQTKLKEIECEMTDHGKEPHI